MRRPLALALLPIFGIGLLVHVTPGCGGGSLAIQDLCGWLGDPNNCYRRLADGAADPADDVGPKCGAFVTGTAAEPIYTQNGEQFTIENKKPTFGGFVSREKLDVCILLGENGGQVAFDPPLDPNAFPPAPFAFKMIDGQGDECGTGSYASANSFSIGFTEPMGSGTTTGSGSTTSSSSGSGTYNTDPFYYGTFSITAEETANLSTTICPNEEKHRFNLLQLLKCDGVDQNGAATDMDEEDNFAAILPTAQLEVSAGGIGIAGYVRFRVLWPPPGDVPLSGAAPNVVEYFDCQFPGPPHPCKDGEQNGAETDVDCGKVACDTQLCLDGQGCLTGEDCASGVCEPNAKGIKKCVGDAPP